jgi:hypothetical protein
MAEKVGECLNCLVSLATEEGEERGEDEAGVKTRRRSSRKLSNKQQKHPNGVKIRGKLEYRFRFLQIETGRLLLLINLWVRSSSKS